MGWIFQTVGICLVPNFQIQVINLPVGPSPSSPTLQVTASLVSLFFFWYPIGLCPASARYLPGERKRKYSGSTDLEVGIFLFWFVYSGWEDFLLEREIYQPGDIGLKVTARRLAPAPGSPKRRLDSWSPETRSGLLSSPSTLQLPRHLSQCHPRPSSAFGVRKGFWWQWGIWAVCTSPLGLA